MARNRKKGKKTTSLRMEMEDDFKIIIRQYRAIVDPLDEIITTDEEAIKILTRLGYKAELIRLDKAELITA